MKLSAFAASLALLSGLSAMAQQQQAHRCGTQMLLDHREAQMPGYRDQVDQTFDRVARLASPTQHRNIYTIPVVVHVVYNTPDQNLHDSIIHNQIAVLNEDYRRMNADTVNLRSIFQPLVGDAQIQFQLASVNPQGGWSTGITRTETSLQTFMGFGGMADLERVKSTVNGGIDPWDQSKYLNIWICNMDLFGTPFLLGYATPPDGLPHWPAGSTQGLADGVVIQWQVFGANNPNPIDMGQGPLDIRGRTVTHEVGHYLGLRHIWGDGDCTEDDGVADTPNADAESNFDCDTTKNSCVDTIPGFGDLPDMVENYMDYSAESCQNSFTVGQIAIMTSVLDNERWDLVNNNPAASLAEKDMMAMELYPNPARGEVHLNLENTVNAQLTIVDLQGKVVHSSDVNTSQVHIDISGFSPGVYAVQLHDGEGVRIAIERLVVR